MKTKYLNNPDYNFEKVNRASLACGPMVKWAIAQVTVSVSLVISCNSQLLKTEKKTNVATDNYDVNNVK